MDKHERVRLLLVDGEDTINGRGRRISHGAATLVSRWPGYIISAIWFVIFVISIVTLLLILAFTVLVKEERKILDSKKIFTKFHHESYKLENDFCHKMTSESSPRKRELPNIEVFNTGNNLFYIRTKPLNKQSSCAVESILKNFGGKKLFILMLEEYEPNYENVLKQKYSNLITSKVDGTKYLKGTPFKWNKNDFNKSMIAAGLITVWQFGGTVLSDNLISYKKQEHNKEETIDGSCIVDYELLSCAEQCAGYVYDFIKALLDYNEQDGAAPVIEKSIHNFCGKDAEECGGARRARNICDIPTRESNCEFVRLDSWLENEQNWTNIEKYCPVTHRRSIEANTGTTEKHLNKTTTLEGSTGSNSITKLTTRTIESSSNTARSPFNVTKTAPVSTSTTVKQKPQK